MSQTTTYKTLKRDSTAQDLSGRDEGLFTGVPQARWSDGAMGGGYAKPDPNFLPSRTPDGQPDIQGIWAATTVTASQTVEANLGETGAFFLRETGSLVVDPSDGKIPYQLWARASIQNLKVRYISPMAACAPTGIPRQMYYYDLQIVQAPGEVVVINEHLPNFRHIPLDGHPHIAKDMKLWMGDSRGHWAGNTLVIDVTNLSDGTLLSGVWDFHSDQEHVTERLTPIDRDTIQYEATVEDPAVYERAWKMSFPLTRLPKSYELLEENCAEGNRSVDTQMRLGRKPFIGITDAK